MNKIIFDPIHGNIEITEKCLKIIDTPEFQRLRNIKQLGACEYVFPGATHNRFSHSVGTFYLAQKLIYHIKNNQPELNISLDDIESVEIAALCHDLGHGPFSHCLDNHCLNKVENNFHIHEYRSIGILELISKKYDIEININKIRKMIVPEKNNRNFLYNIVSNPISGLDVDKFDYIARDTYFLGLEYSFNCDRLIRFTKIINNELCFPEKLVFNIYELFRVRYKLYREIYNHPVVSAIEFMIVDILKDKIIDIKDLNNFCKLDDSIVRDHKLFNLIQKRDIYKLISQKVLKKNQELELNELGKNKIRQILKLGHNKENKNPVTNINFFKNNKIVNLDTNELTLMFPEIFIETVIRIYEKNSYL
jgi:deoxynucleoside triphosphate triphosphohydrolase SAMHD1